MAEPASNAAPQPAAAATPKRRIALWKKILAAVLAVVVLLAVLILGTPKPCTVPAETSPAESWGLFGVIGKIAKLGNEARKNPDRPVQITLSPQELNVLLTTGIRQYEADREPNQMIANANWKDGVFHFKASYPIGCGLAVNLASGIVPELQEGEPHLRLTYFRLGSLPIPCALLQGSVDQAVREQTRDRNFAAILTFVEKIETDAENGITLEFAPGNYGKATEKILKW